MRRSGGRKANQLRPVTITRGFSELAHGSAMIDVGRTRVLCTASFETGVPSWRTDSGLGWVTAEYDMLPASTGWRRPRNRTRVDGRTQEIQRLIGRSMRAVVDFARLGQNTLWLDCDVVQADGGTRTASITGAYVALCDAVSFSIKQGWLTQSPLTDAVAAVSVGVVDRQTLLDLEYTEDVKALVDFNVVMTGNGEFVEIQGTGEQHTFTRGHLDRMLKLAETGIRKLLQEQQRVLGRRIRR
jgi:ribonuclease PH